jgi:D-threonine aldolase
MSATPWYRLQGGEIPDTPALAVYPARIEQNIRRMVELVGSADRLRPHVKTHKLAEVVRMQLRAGITRFKCATIAEAEMLALESATSVLLAYQPLGPKTERLIALMRRYPETRFAALVDHPDAARMISVVYRNHGERLDVYVDINNGMNRTGCAPGDAAALFRLCTELPGLNPVGLHVYDGHIRERDARRRQELCDQAFGPVEQLVAAIRAEFLLGPEIVAGGSPTFALHARRVGVQCSPGTNMLWDAGYSEAFPDLPFQPAAMLLTRVVSMPAPGLVCLDVGHKSVAAENPLPNRLRFPDVEGLEPVGHSEEHLVLRNTGGTPLKPGDLLYALPYHICPTVALYDRVAVVQDGRVGDFWKVAARDRKINI